MTVFNELLAPVMPIIQTIEQDRSRHPNEHLTWPDFVRILVYFFTKERKSANELIVALRAAEPELNLLKTSKRALSEGFWRFSPALLRQVLATHLSTHIYPENPELAFISSLYVVDGSIFPLITEMYWPKTKDIIKSVKLHLKFALNIALPAEFIIGDEHSSERDAFRAMMQAGQTYIIDRGYMEYQLLQDVRDAQAWVVMRGYNNMEVETVEERSVTLPDAVKNHWIHVRDRIVHPKDNESAHILFRLVECTVGTTTYRLITNLYALTTFQIILLYAYRWQIELIFRYLKHAMHGVHVITKHPIGIQNFFSALFLTTLLHLHLKQRCLAEEGHTPPNEQSMQLDTDDTLSKTSKDPVRPTNHLAIARFFAKMNNSLLCFWKVSKHWLHTLADCLSRPFAPDIVRLLNICAIAPI
jgi:hypothetical protein